jgi:hypothetical protein
MLGVALGKVMGFVQKHLKTDCSNRGGSFYEALIFRLRSQLPQESLSDQI